MNGLKRIEKNGIIFKKHIEIKINQIINKHLNKTALILGHGPSLDLIKKDLDLYKKNGIVLFGCNQWFSIYNTSPHYWVMASNDDTIEIGNI